MSDVRPQNRSAAPRVGWQGRRRGRDDGPRFRWQVGLASRPTARLERRQRRQQRLLLLFALGLVALAAFFLHQTLFLPVETPYLAVVPPAYSYPLAPHAWAAEDVQSLAVLDGSTLAISADSSAWRTRERGLADLERRLEDLAQRRWRSEAIVLHISMPGAIKLGANGRPVPCLVPPDASPTDAATWLPLADVFRLLAAEELPDEVHKLVILDCSRRLVDWHLGQLYNGFNEALPGAVRQARQAGAENLVVLSACSPGEQAWAGPEIRASVFGRYLQLGLAGAADLRSEQGDGDGRVSLRELHRYLRKSVDRWARHFRDARQRPRLIPPGVDFNVAWSASPATLRSLMQQAEIVAEAPPSVERAALVELWQAHDELAGHAPLRYAPLAWCRFEQQLLWLEEASRAGSAYDASAARLRDELLRWSREAKQRAAAAEADPSLVNETRVFSDEQTTVAFPGVARSLPLAQLLGGVEATRARSLTLAWREAAARAGDDAALRQALDAWDSAEGLPAAVETQLLHLLDRYQAGDSWRGHPEVLGRALESWSAAERACGGQIAAVRSTAPAPATPGPRPERFAAELNTYVPADLRAHRWVRPDMHAADGRRRAAFDLLLAGENAAGREGLETWDQVDRALSDAKAALGRFTLAYRNRDATLALAPYFARWLMRPQPLSRPTSRAGRQLRGTLLPLIEANQKLATALGHAPAFDEPAMMAGAAFGDDATVGRLLGELQDEFAQHCLELIVPHELTEEGELAAAESPQPRGANREISAAPPAAAARRLAVQRRDIEAALQLPIIPWDRREKLWARRRIVVAQLRDRFLQSGDSAHPAAADRPGAEDVAADRAADEDADDDFTDYLEFAADPRRQHPALALLASDDPRVRNLLEVETPPAQANDSRAGDGETREGVPDADEPDEAGDGDEAVDRSESVSLVIGVARQGQLVRDHLLRLPLDIATYHIDESPNPASSIDALDRRARAACGFGLTTLSAAPDELVRRHEVQQLLLWQARRAIDDALGPARAADAPFFELAARDYLAAAENVLAPAPAVARQLHDLHDLLEVRRRALRSGIVTTAADILMLDVLDDLTARIAVQTGADAAGLPAGRPFVMLRDPAQSGSRARIAGATQLVDLSALQSDEARREFTSELAPDELLGRGAALDAVTVLRGNEFAARVLLKVPRGAQVSLDRHHYGPPQVTVFGRPRKRPSIEFVVDCSNTMSKLMDVEGPGGAALPRTSRLDVAKVALAGMLDRLAREGDVRAGVRLFGHRVGRNPRKPEEILRQNGYAQARQIPPELQPYADVEAVLPLGRLDTASAESVKTLLESVVPWGETPLYLAITQALGEMREDDDTERIVVVVTDGMNNQFDPPPEFAADEDDVLEARGDRPIRLFIVGFGIEDSTTEQSASTQSGDEEQDDQTVGAFSRLADATGGRYFSATSAQQLIDFIEELLGPSEFSVRDAAGDVVRTSEVGRPAVLPPQSAPRRYVASFDSASAAIDLVGGEAVELESEPSGTRLLALPHRYAAPRSGALVETATPEVPGDESTLVPPSDDANAGRELRAVVERPIWKQEEMLFSVWFESQGRRFTPRPAEVWAQITPLSSSDAAPPPYLFYDANFEPGTSTPLLRCAVRDWPRDASRAQIDVWCSYSLTRPSAVVALADVANVPPPAPAGFAAPVAGVFYRVRRRRPAAPGAPLEVSVVEQHTADSDGLDALKVQCHPPPDHIEHLFDADNRLVVHTFLYQAGSPEPQELRFSTRGAVQAGALHLTGPLEVEIFDNRDTVDLSAQ